MANTLLMPKATAVWLVDNTALSFDQIAQFCSLHPLEVKAIADGESAQGIKGMDPIMTGQLSRAEIAKGEGDINHRLKLSDPKVRVPEAKRKGPRYTPLSKRQDRPNAIYWLVKNHPELKDAQISRLVGTTKATIEQIRERKHWNMATLSPLDPVAPLACARRSTSTSKCSAPRAAAKLRHLTGDTLLPASLTERLTPEQAAPRDEDKELDANAVFAKLSALKSKNTDSDDE
jgi:hypothetical protein